MKENARFSLPLSIAAACFLCLFIPFLSQMQAQAQDVPLPVTNVNVKTIFGTVHGAILFAGQDAEHGTELWRSDGTTSGTFLVKDIRPGASGVDIDNSKPRSFIIAGDVLYFPGNDDIHSTELWRSDGTTSGTYMVADLVPGNNDSSPQQFTVSNGYLFFIGGLTLYRMKLPTAAAAKEEWMQLK